MPQAAVITIADGQATPVNFSFGPVRQEGGVGLFEERSIGIGSLFKTLRVWVQKKTSGVYKTGVSFAVPVSKVENGLTVVAHTMRFNGEFIFHENCTPQNRADMLAFVKNSFSHAQVIGPVRDYDPTY